MPYDPEKDKVLKRWESEDTGLVVSINQYDQSEPKLQIGPRMFTKKDGSQTQRKAGRLTLEDVNFLYEIIDEVKEELASRISPNPDYS
ncbi:MAG: hypothetical protein JRI97_12080 [Deltaproteobacteria bacterium]|nr:hypothetical protein [Deltaproteobacteria bacterium]